MSISPKAIELDKLRNNLHAILIISDQFLPYADLKKATEKLCISDKKNNQLFQVRIKKQLVSKIVF